VTGSSRGIGLRIAQVFGSAGARVCLMGRDGQRLAAATKVLGDMGVEVTARAGSASDSTDINATVDHCLEQFGSIDIVVNNAGTDLATPLLDPDWDGVEDMWQLNYFGTWRMVESAFKAYMGEHGGSIVNISSTAALRARTIMAAYGMSKMAMADLTRRLAVDLGPGVRINCIAPGVIMTEMLRELWTQEGSDNLEVDGEGPWPLRRMGDVDDVASAALYLASDAASWVTGHTLVVDGGAFML
jgi:NAD(P)-dependent dehydrogenase (short-subunit alcohol dehydrogenase family)